MSDSPSNLPDLPPPLPPLPPIVPPPLQELRYLLDLAFVMVAMALPLVAIINAFTTEWDDGIIPRVFVIPLAMCQLILLILINKRKTW